LATFRAAGLPGFPDSEATVIGSQSGSNIFLPFDNTQGFVTGLALANTNPTQTLSVTLTFTPQSGAPTNRTIFLPPHGHTSFALPTAYPSTAGVRGALNLIALSPDLSVVGLRFSPKNTFTSLGSFQ